MNLTDPATAPAPAACRFVTFFVNRIFFGVDVLRVQEVLPARPITRVPQAPNVIEGVINLRGQIVTAVDMRRRLHTEARASGASPINVILRTEDGPVSLLVDEIGEVVEADGSSYEHTPENVTPEARDLVRGVHKLDSGLLLILDADRAAGVPAGTRD